MSLPISRRAMASLLNSTSPSTRRLQCVANHVTAAEQQSWSEKCFSKGSILPPLTPNKLRLYSMRFCPYAQRTRLVLEYKNIPHETINVDLKHKPDWFLEKNPIGVVPVLELNDQIISESLATCLWLDEVYPQKRLHPTDPYKKAQDLILMEYFSKVAGVFDAFKRSEMEAEKGIKRLLNYYQFYENALKQRGGPYLGGVSVALVDFFIWPHMERIPAIIAKRQPRCAVDPERFPYLAKWFEVMYTEPAVKKTILDDESHQHFATSLARKEPDYDYGL